MTHLLAILQHPLFGSDTALGSGWVGLPAACLNVNVHVEFPTEHGHLGLSYSKPCAGIGCECLQKWRREQGRQLMQP